MQSPPSALILIVDDEPGQRVLTRRAMTMEGHECVEAATVTEARSLLATKPGFDLVISDISMPGESGMNLVRWLRQEHPEMAVLMATGVDDRATANEAISLGVYGYLVKPFGVNELRIAVANALQRDRLERLHRDRSVELEQLVAQRTEQLQATAVTLSDRENRLSSLVSSAPVGVLYADLDGACEYVNDVAAKMAGRDAADLLGDGFLRSLHPDDVETVLHQLENARNGHEPTAIEHRVVRPNGDEVIAHTRIAPVLDEQRDATAFVAVVEDVTEQRRFEQTLAHKATHDDLTGLPNRNLLVDRIEQTVVGGSGTLLLIDLDRFKFINDSQGHAVGDGVLVALADAIREAFPPEDTVARLGGDEFVIVTAANTEVAIVDAAKLILSTLGTVKGPKVEMGSVSASIGVAMVRPSSTAEEVLRNADIAMYRAKERGGGRYEIFDDEFGRLIQERVRLEGELRTASHRGQLEVFYQPQVACTDGRLMAVEALIRWRHPSRGLLPASAFIHLAEDAGILEEITEFVLNESMAQAVAWMAETPSGEPVAVAINVGARELESGRLNTRIARELAVSGLDPGRLTIEVTESSLIHDLDLSGIRLEALRALGVRISLDDFGTGYSSLAYLSRLPIDELKIDRTFVQRLGQLQDTPDRPPADRQMVEAIIELAAIFGLDVVAEGIENPKELELLQGMGCSAVQGYLIGRPMPASAERLLALVRGSNAQPHFQRN